MDKLTYLTEQALQALPISSADIIAAIETVLAGIPEGSVTVAPKTASTTPDGRYVMATLATSDESGLVAVKCVLSNAKNKAKQLPTINGAMLLLDSQSGVLRGVLDANWITAVRTAGLSAVAAKRLANPGSSVIALIGAGVQAESHLRTFSDLFPLGHVMVAGRSDAGVRHIQSVADELQFSFEAATPQACLQRADIVISSVTLDFNIEPFLNAAWLRQGAFAAIIDQARPWVTDGQSSFDRIYIDDVIQEKTLNKPMVDMALVTGDLSDLVAGPMQYDPDGRAAFIFRGIAAGDLAVAALAFRKATEIGLT